MISKQKKPLKRNEYRFAAASMVLVIVVVLLAAMMSGCINQGNDSENETDNGSGGRGFSAPLENLEEDEKNEENKSNQTSSSSLPDVVVATNSDGGGRSGGSSSIWLKSVSNPFIGTWVSDPDENGIIIVYKGNSNGTFDYEMRNIPEEWAGLYPSEGDGAYIVKKNDGDGTNVVISYFDFEMIQSSRFEVISNNLIQLTEFTLNEDGQKDYGEAVYFRREGTAVRSDYVSTALDNIFMDFGELGWGADIPELEEPGMFYPSVWEFGEDGTVICTFLGLAELYRQLEIEYEMDLGMSDFVGNDIPYPFSYSIYGAAYGEEGYENGVMILYTASEEGNQLFL